MPTSSIDVALVLAGRTYNEEDFAPLAAGPDVSFRVLRFASDWGHPDLVILPGTTDVAADFDALEAGHMVVELNTAGWHKPCAVQYPDEDVLRELLRRGIPVVVNSDAHAPSLLSRDYERAVRVLRDVAPRGLRECRCATPVSGAELHAFVSC